MKMKSLEEKVAVVTGAGQGIGFEVCRQLAASGAKVILNDVDEILAKDAAKKINDEGGKCEVYTGDASDRAMIDNMVCFAVNTFGRLDIAIANAGLSLFGDFLNYSQESFERVVKVNLSGSFFFAQAAARQLIQQKEGGSILFTSSVTAHQAHKNLAAYSMTKAALEMLAKNLVIELSPHRINVNAIAPGATLTERTMDEKNYEATWSKLTPMGRPATVADIAHAALFLVSDKARHITGQTLVIDGGWSSVSPSPDEE